MKVKEIMHGATEVDKGTSVLEVARLMKKKNIGSVLTSKSGSCFMIVTERNIINDVVAEKRDPAKVKISEIMVKCTHTIDSSKDVVDASAVFNKHDIRRLPVMEKGRIIGIVTARDVAKSLSYMSARKTLEYGRRTYSKP